MTTIVDVAKRAQVSITTVSRFLNHKGPISRKTSEAIVKAIEELGFKPNFFAKGMRTSVTKTIGIIIPDFRNLFYPELFFAIDSYFRDHGYMTLVTNTDASSASEYGTIEELVSRKVDGLILFSYNRIEEDIEYLCKLSDGIPIVVMDPLVKNEPLSYVISEGCRGTAAGTEYLIERGRRRIAYIKGPNKVFVTKERYLGYKRAIAKRGIALDKSLVIEGDFSIASGFMAAKSLIESGTGVDAIMAVNDMMAIGAMKYLNSRKIRIPEDVNVIGFDNIQLCDIVEPPLTTIAQPIGLLGRTAAELIVDSIIEMGEKKAAGKKQVVLETELVIRGTTS